MLSNQVCVTAASYTNKRAVRLMFIKFQLLWPNMAVKGTLRTQALLKVSGLFGFVGSGLGFHPARPLPLRWTTYTTGRRFGAIDLPAKKWYQDTAAVVA